MGVSLGVGVPASGGSDNSVGRGAGSFSAEDCSVETSGGMAGPREAEAGISSIDKSTEASFLSLSLTTLGALSAVGDVRRLLAGVLSAAPIVGDTDNMLCFGTIKYFLSPIIVMLCGLGAWTASRGFLGGELLEFN